MKYLVFGFSVTSEDDGYVERCAALRAQTHPDDEIVKVAIGGLGPDLARHLVGGFITAHQPDALIIEVSTAAYRVRPETPANIADHTASMEAMFAICKAQGIRCGLLDLPRTDVEDEADWMVRMHVDLSRSYNIPHRIVPLTDGTLRDFVHPNDAGKDLYAGVLSDLINTVHQTAPDFGTLLVKQSFEAFAIKDLDIPNAKLTWFARAGFKENMLTIEEGETAEIIMPKPVLITGLIMLMGPTSGTFLIKRGDIEDRMHCYDRNCYYRRVNGKHLKPVMADRLSVSQSDARPSEELQKGEKNEGPRAGGITHVCYQNISSKNHVIEHQ